MRLAWARVAELADAPDLGSGVFGHRGSSPLSRTIKEVSPLKNYFEEGTLFHRSKPPPLSRQNASKTRKFAETANCVGTTNSRPLTLQIFQANPLGRLIAYSSFSIEHFLKTIANHGTPKLSSRQQQSKDSPFLALGAVLQSPPMHPSQFRILKVGILQNTRQLSKLSPLFP